MPSLALADADHELEISKCLVDIAAPVKKVEATLDRPLERLDGSRNLSSAGHEFVSITL
jgi:hypothetical protein